MTPRFAVLVPLAIGACTHVVHAPAPAADVAFAGTSYLASYPIADGTDIVTRALWGGDCSESELSAGSPLPHASRSLVGCSDQDFSARVECVGRAFPAVPLSQPCEISDETGVHLGRVDLASVHGTGSFHVRLHGPEEQIIRVTMRHDRETYRYQTPPLRVEVPADFVVECKRDNGQLQETWPAEPCDAEPLTGREWIDVRSTTQVPLGVISIAGHPARDGVPVPLGQVLPSEPLRGTPSGDFPVHIDVNPPPATIRRTVTIRVRPISDPHDR